MVCYTGPKVYNLVLNITDNGVPPLTTLFTIQVTITDVNDPPVLISTNETSVPLFSTESLRLSPLTRCFCFAAVPENSQISVTLFQMVAFDEDGHTVMVASVSALHWHSSVVHSLSNQCMLCELCR